VQHWHFSTYCHICHTQYMLLTDADNLLYAVGFFFHIFKVFIWLAVVCMYTSFIEQYKFSGLLASHFPYWSFVIFCTYPPVIWLHGFPVVTGILLYRWITGSSMMKKFIGMEGHKYAGRLFSWRFLSQHVLWFLYFT